MTSLPEFPRERAIESSNAPLTRVTLQDGVYDRLREALMRGDFAPGQRLTVREVATQMGTSAMPVREAFRRLTSASVLEPLASGATRVPQLSPEQMARITEIRLLTEGLAAERAASRITSRDIALLKQVQNDWLAAISRWEPSLQARLNERFHFIIYRAADAPELLAIIENHWLRVGPYIVSRLKQAGPKRLPVRKRSHHHYRIIAMLEKRDARGACDVMKEDIALGVLRLDGRIAVT